MAWTTPRTWVAGELVTATMMNTHVRDNMNFVNQYSWTIATTVATGTQNDFDPGIVGNTIIRVQSASALTITGFPAGFNGQQVRLFSAAAGKVETVHNSGGSSGGNKLFNFMTSGGNTPLAIPTVMNPTMLYAYDTGGSRWQLQWHEQGEWISWTSTWGNTGTANTIGNGAVAASFLLRGRVCHYRIKLTWGSTTAAGNGMWTFTLPFTTDGITLAGAGHVQAFDNSAGQIYGSVLRDVSTTAVGVSSSASPSAVYGTTVPFTWAQSDLLIINGTFGAA